MLVCLDVNVVIYLIEANPVWGPRAAARITALRSAGHEIAVGDAARLECLVLPHRTGNAAILAGYQAFFNSPTVHMLPVTVPAWERAPRIRADHGFQALDSLHLATAVEHGCGLFLTNDAHLRRFPDIRVEVP